MSIMSDGPEHLPENPALALLAGITIILVPIAIGVTIECLCGRMRFF